MIGVKWRVARGVKLLDKRMPGWDERINLHRLDMGNGTHCVLGQLYGDYYRGLDVLLGDNSNSNGYHYAFNTYFLTSDVLDREWTRVITDRRIAAAERFIKDEDQMDRLNAWANA